MFKHFLEKQKYYDNSWTTVFEWLISYVKYKNYWLKKVYKTVSRRPPPPKKKEIRKLL